ncbi:MAG: UDP-N-acetylmuramoyl-L-alanine--D-glutamate ligase [Candidatus Komeilibacteria bacterium]
MSKLNFKNRNIVIMGLGLHGGGLGVAHWLLKHQANLTITDLKSAQELKASLQPLQSAKNIKYTLGKHLMRDFVNADIVVANPIVRQNSQYLQKARQRGALIYNDASLFLQYCPAKVVGITGTKGKSTTASLIYHLLKQGSRKVYLGGNIRISPFVFLDKLTKEDLVVLELSSWQCEGLPAIKKSVEFAVITNFAKDHLNSYPSYTAYKAAKLNLFKYQKRGDIAIHHQNIKTAIGQGKKMIFNDGVRNYFKNNVLYINKKKVLARDRIALIGQHNEENILAAICIAQQLKISTAKILKGLQSYCGLTGRAELISTKSGIRYINDTTATAPVAAIATFNAILTPKILIAGGVDKKLEYQVFASLIAKNSKSIILLPGSATDIIVKLFDKSHYHDYHLVKSMKEAVILSSKLAQAGDTVLLSPGAASFGLFQHEFDRGEQFIKAVKSL